MFYQLKVWKNKWQVVGITITYFSGYSSADRAVGIFVAGGPVTFKREMQVKYKSLPDLRPGRLLRK
jgi:hypothetical protein